MNNGGRLNFVIKFTLNTNYFRAGSNWIPQFARFLNDFGWTMMRRFFFDEICWTAHFDDDVIFHLLWNVRNGRWTMADDRTPFRFIFSLNAIYFASNWISNLHDFLNDFWTTMRWFLFDEIHDERNADTQWLTLLNSKFRFSGTLIFANFRWTIFLTGSTDF